jgi:hypothetical protein
MIVIILALSILNMTMLFGQPSLGIHGPLQPNQEYYYTNATIPYVITDSHYKITVNQNYSIEIKNTTK